MGKRKRQRRSWFGWLGNLLSSARWMKYAFVLVDGAIIIGITLLVTSGIKPDNKKESLPEDTGSAREILTMPVPKDTENAKDTMEAPDPEKELEDSTEPLENEVGTENEVQDADGDTFPENGDSADAPDEGSSGGEAEAVPDPPPAAPVTEDTQTTPEETPPPETEPPTTPEQTAPPETAPPAPPVTVMPYVGNIHALSQDQINFIRGNYDCNGRGYGGITYWQSAPSVQSQMDSMGINCRTLVPGGNTVALTFQEGWEPGYTGQLLDILAQKGVKGNFYITHGYAVSRPDLVWRMINEGHTVGSHTYACPDTAIAYFNLEDIMNDAMRMQQYMHDTFGYDMHAYNYNSGAWSPGSAKMLSDMGYTVVLCSNSYSDYSAYDYIDPNVWLPQLQAGLIPGSIYAFHVTNPVTIQMIGPLIDYIRSRGFTFVLI